MFEKCLPGAMTPLVYLNTIKIIFNFKFQSFISIFLIIKTNSKNPSKVNNFLNKYIIPKILYVLKN